jgi:phosphoribosylanthranilate isomerase
LTSIDEAVACADLGADWIGLNFHPPSPRYVEPARAESIVAKLPASASPVGVFADRPAAEVAEIASRVGLKIVQLHGQESPEVLSALAPLRVIKAFRLDGYSAWVGVVDYLAQAAARGCAPYAVLIDTYVAGKPGGTGKTIDEDFLAGRPPVSRLILAGGLTSENVADHIRRVRPWMVDVASGVESAPGCKDLAKVAAFVQAARTALPDSEPHAEP